MNFIQYNFVAVEFELFSTEVFDSEEILKRFTYGKISPLLLSFRLCHMLWSKLLLVINLTF